MTVLILTLTTTKAGENTHKLMYEFSILAWTDMVPRCKCKVSNWYMRLVKLILFSERKSIYGRSFHDYNMIQVS